MSVLALRDVVGTGERSPAQWEARTTDDRPVYIRYRWGYLSIYLGPPGGSIDDAFDAGEWFGRQLGDKLDGYIAWEDVCSAADLASSPWPTSTPP